MRVYNEAFYAASNTLGGTIMRRRKYPKSIKYSIMLGAAVLIILCLPWYRIDGEAHTAFGMLYMIQKAGGVPGFCRDVMRFTAEDTAAGSESLAHLFYVLCWAHALLIAAELLNIVRRLRRVPAKVLDVAVLLWTAVLSILLMNVTFIDFNVILYGFAASAAALTAFFLRKLQESEEGGEGEDAETQTLTAYWQENNQKFKEWKKKEKRHYTKDFYKVVFKNFKSNARTFILFFSSAAMSVMMIFMMTAMKSMLEGVNSSQGASANGEMSQIIQSAVIVVGAVCMFLMAFSLRFYINSRTRDYGIFLVLGIRQSTLSMLMALEYASSIVISVLAGLLAGSVGAVVLRGILMIYYPQSGGIAFPGITVYGSSALISILLCALSASINYDVYVEADLGNTLRKPNTKERMPLKKQAVRLVIGLVIVAAGAGLYSQRIFFEDVKLLFVCGAGSYFVLRYGGSMILGAVRRNKERYYKYILPLNQFYYRFKGNINYMFAIFLLDVFILFYFSAQIIGNIPNEKEDLCPYDDVCLLDQEETQYFTEFEQKYEAKTKTIPMIRLTVPDITPKREDPVATDAIPQGQQIGISESAYKEFTGKTLNLKDKEIWISYQQSAGDHAHPLDFSALRRDPHLRMGRPVSYGYLERINIFPTDYKVVGEERRMLIGRLERGYQENIVVFSDEFFQEAYPEAEGEKYMTLVSVPEKYYQDAQKDLERSVGSQYEGETLYDSSIRRVAERSSVLSSIRSKQLFSLLVNGLLLLALVFSGIFIQFVRAEADLPEMKKRYEFLLCMGMYQKSIKKLMLREFQILRIVPVILAAGVSAGLWTVTAVLRGFQASDIQFFFGWGLVIAAVYAVVQIVGSMLMLRHIWKMVQK